MREQRIDTELGQLAVFEMGDGPVAFLWPSLYVDHRSLVPVATELARSRRCVLVDGPGHGQSSVPPRRYTIRDCAHAATQVLDVLGVDCVDWIGNAWGGHVGIAAALTSAARLRSLAVIGSPLEPLSPSLRRKTLFALGLLALGARDLVGALVSKAMIAPGSPKAHHDYVRSCFRDAPSGGISLAVRSISLGREDLRPELLRIAVATLFVAGTDDPLWPVETARCQAAAIAGSWFETVAGGAHLVPLERPAETHAAIARFWAALDAPRATA